MSRFTPSDLVVTLASPAQRLESWSLNSASWAPPLPASEYIARETLLSSSAMMQSSLYFVAVLPSDPSTVVTSCEALRKECLVRSTAAADAAPRRTAAYAIASVYTNPAFRQRGAAAILLRAVQQHLDARDAAASVLYSDIGRAYYARLGWAVHSTTQTVVVPVAGLAGPVRALADADMPDVAARTEAVLAARLAAAEAAPAVLFIPTAAQLAWTLQRADLMGRFFVHGSVGAAAPALVVRGAESRGGASWMVWEHNIRDGKMKVLVFVAGNEEEAVDVVRAAEREACAWGLRKIELWNVQGAEMAALQKAAGGRVQTEEREHSIPSLRWKNGEMEGEGEWVGNEYYAWC